MPDIEQPGSPISKLTEPRTIISFIIAIILLYFLFLQVDLKIIIEVIKEAQLIYVAAAACVYFGSLPVRGIRWKLLLDNVKVKTSLSDASEIYLLGWFANCLIPAKMGDVYRAYLAKKTWGLSISKGYSTIYIERIYDVLLLVFLMGISSILVFGMDIPSEIRFALAAGFLIVSILITSIIVFSSGKTAISNRLPPRIKQIFIRFTEGLQESSGRNYMSLIIFFTLLMWAMEIARLYFVVESLSSIGNFSISISVIIFVALSSSLLSALPITPGGLGAVEFAIMGILLLVGLDSGISASIAILDRAISYWGLVIAGGVVYIFSKKK